MVKPISYCLASYKGTYSNEQSLNFVIPIIVILFLGIIYIMSQRTDSGFVSFILIGGAADNNDFLGKSFKENDKRAKTTIHSS